MFPLEIFETIMQLLVSDSTDDITTLRSCSYVSPALRAISQKHLFSTVTLELFLELRDMFLVEDPSKSLGHRFLDLITHPQSSHIAPLVQKVWIRTIGWDDDSGLSETGDTQTLPPWYERHIDTQPTSIHDVLPLLPRLNTLRLGVASFPLCLGGLHKASRDAILDACKTCIVSLDICRQSSFPFEKLNECLVLRHLAIHEAPTLPVVTGAERGRLTNPRVQLDTLCVLPGCWSQSDLPGDSWIARPNCPIDVTRLRRLVLEAWGSLHPDNILPLCASTLEEFSTQDSRLDDQVEEYSKPMHKPDMWHSRPLDISRLARLKTLKVQARYIVFPGNMRYASSLPWVGASLATILSDSPLSTLIIEIELSCAHGRDSDGPFGHAHGDVVMGFSFSPLREALITGGGVGQEGRLRCANLTRIELNFRVANAYLQVLGTPPLFQTHPDLLPFLQLGVLHITYKPRAYPRVTDIFDGSTYYGV